jgi:diaminohydroxyphosphoribosylaminopyrimidine deaminase/5-amino-6-(5-phosphoribosylamino)uracil reductase
LLRVILDSHLRLPLESRLVQSVASAATIKNDVLVFCSLGDEKKKRALEACGIRVEQITAADGRPDLHAVLRRLGQLETTSVMIEGGSAVNATAFASGVVDKVFLYYAPKIMASEGSVPFAAGRFHRTNDPPRIKHLHLHHFGEDFAVEGYLRDPYEE